jgi:hypothetical protein
MLQHALAGRREFRIVPLLVGPLSDAVEAGAAPSTLPDVARMVAALQAAESALGGKVCYVISGDLAHIGPKFGDPWMIDTGKAAWNRAADAEFVANLAAGRPETLFAGIAAEQDERRVCGFPPAYTTLAAADLPPGQVLHHDQYVDPRGEEIVGFAAVAFDRD